MLRRMNTYIMIHTKRFLKTKQILILTTSSYFTRQPNIKKSKCIIALFHASTCIFVKQSFSNHYNNKGMHHSSISVIPTTQHNSHNKHYYFQQTDGQRFCHTTQITFLTASLVVFPIVFLRYVHCNSRFVHRVMMPPSTVMRPALAVVASVVVVEALQLPP